MPPEATLNELPANFVLVTWMSPVSFESTFPVRLASSRIETVSGNAFEVLLAMLTPMTRTGGNAQPPAYSRV
ncbi:hypothetical protein D9M72_344260 [compost metagenome]